MPPPADPHVAADLLPLRPAPDGEATGVPDNWQALWGPGAEDPLAAKQLAKLQSLTGELAADVPLSDLETQLSGLVGASDLRLRPIHRWFSYKEGFSPLLPGTVLDLLGAGPGLVAGDCFGGVGTTALALLEDPRVREVRSSDYSPLAAFVGQTKLRWVELEPARLSAGAQRLISYRKQRAAAVPALAAFSDPRIFEPHVVSSLQAARSAIIGDSGLTGTERDFFLVGLAAVVEDASKAMKDGRALRIRGDRARIRTSLESPDGNERRFRDPVKRLLAGQWTAMIDDVAARRRERHAFADKAAWHVRCDARNLRRAQRPDGAALYPSACLDVSIFSPPYLNFIDYSEVYKLELWLLRHVESQSAFRRLRLGTLRSHPSVRFGERPAPGADAAPVFDLVHRLSGWVTEYGSRPEVGPVVRQYFEDMHDVYREQYRVLRPGGTCVCVVANSTLSRRDKSEGSPREMWRIPVLTDVMIGHIARQAGFEDVRLWRARDLRPRNVRGGAARESLVVARKPD